MHHSPRVVFSQYMVECIKKKLKIDYKIHIGIDFDNTIVDYQNIFYQNAIDLGYLKQSTLQSKNSIKQKVLDLNNGEKKWGILQSRVYGIGIKKARIMKDFKGFLQKCRINNLTVSIISHKSMHNIYDNKKLNLQEAAFNWMSRNNFFSTELSFTKKDIYFCKTLDDKINQIKKIGVNFFIDDLEKVLLHPHFPEKTNRILFKEKDLNDNIKMINHSGNWTSIKDYIFKID